jgi:hypothetical protein
MFRSANVWRIPTGMTEFEAVSAVLRKKCQESHQFMGMLNEFSLWLLISTES